MRKLLYWILKPFAWVLIKIIDWSDYLYDDYRHGGFKGVLWRIWDDMKDGVDDFFYDYHHNGVFGPGETPTRPAATALAAGQGLTSRLRSM